MSYVWQAIYAGGLVSTLVYLIFKKALAAWVFIVVELVFSAVFVGFKIYLEKFARRGKIVSFALGYSCFGGVTFTTGPTEAVTGLLDEVKQELALMSFQHTHQFVKALGEQEDEPAGLRGTVHGFVYTNNFAIEVRYSAAAEQLMVQICSHWEMPKIYELSERLDARFASHIPGSFLLVHGHSS